MSKLRDWTLQYSMIWAAVDGNVQGDCDCPEGFTSIGDECQKVSTLPTEQPPTFTPLQFIAKSYTEYSKFGTKIYSTYKLDGTGTFTLYNTLPFWNNASRNTFSGPMNRCGLWTSTYYSYQQIGFSVCFNVPTTKKYLLGFGVDNFCHIRIDGTPVIVMARQEVTPTFDYWHVYEVEIKAGTHILEIIANNETIIASIGAEIYNCDATTLMAIDTVAELDEVTIFSTKNMVGKYTNLGTNGYPVMGGYALADCYGDPPFYRRVEYTPCIEEGEGDMFITEWDLPAASFTLPLRSGYTYNMVVDWGDGSPLSTVTAYNDVDATHIYATAGIYQIKISGKCGTFYINNGSVKSYLKKVIRWGNVGFDTFYASFFGCNNLYELPSGPITGVGTITASGFYMAFRLCTSLTYIPAGLFDNCTSLSTGAFQYTFDNCPITSIPADLFKYNTLVSSSAFYGTFGGCYMLTSLPADLFKYNTIVSTSGFYSTFFGCSRIKTIPSDLFRYNTQVSTSGFYQTFKSCASITAIPTDLFRYNTLVSSSGFYETFSICGELVTIPTDLFRYNTALTTSAFYGTFSSCPKINNIPTDLFRYNTSVSTDAFRMTFQSCDAFTSIPTDLFRYNTLVTSNAFYYTFYDCQGLTSVPTDLFRYNTLVSSNGFYGTFGNCSNLTTAPAALFKYNVDCTSFYATFINCVKLRADGNLFFDNGEEATRFLNKSVSFQNCFYRNSFSGTQGTAPALWNCNFGTGTPTRTTCFGGAGNSATSLTNNADIPAAWR